MFKAIKLYISHCKKCQEVNKHYKREPMKNISRPSTPMEVLAMDLMQFSTSNSGNTYLLNIMCLHSRFARCLPIKDKKASTILKAFFDHWVNVHGLPRQVTSDNAKEFTDKHTQEWAKSNNITWIFTSPYTPRSDVVERLNRTIKRYLRVMVPASKQTDWDDYVSSAQMSYNSAVHRALHHSPFAMVYLRQVNYPWVFYRKEDLDNNDLPWTERAKKFRDIIYEDAAKADKQAKEYNKMSWDKRKGTSSTFGKFKKGDPIWYLNPLPGTGKFAKPYLEASFLEYLGSHTAEISVKNGSTPESPWTGSNQGAQRRTWNPSGTFLTGPHPEKSPGPPKQPSGKPPPSTWSASITRTPRTRSPGRDNSSNRSHLKRSPSRSTTEKERTCSAWRTSSRPPTAETTTTHTYRMNFTLKRRHQFSNIQTIQTGENSRGHTWKNINRRSQESNSREQRGDGRDNPRKRTTQGFPGKWRNSSQ